MAGGGFMDPFDPKPDGNLIRAAQYGCMSMEHQQYSTENQARAIARFAEHHGMKIVTTFTDQGGEGTLCHGIVQRGRNIVWVTTGGAFL
jgi:hypothetical protein